MTLRQRFLRARQSLHWTRQTTAQHLGMSKDAVWRYETESEASARTVPPRLVDWMETIAREVRDVLKRHPAPDHD